MSRYVIWPLKTVFVFLAEEPQCGLAIKRTLEAYYDDEVNHGRLYPNLDSLVQEGYIEKSALDKHTNQYELTDEGYDLLLRQLDWRLSKLVINEDRATEVSVATDSGPSAV